MTKYEGPKLPRPKRDLRTASREALLAVIARQQAIIDGELDTEALRNLASTIFIGRRR